MLEVVQALRAGKLRVLPEHARHVETLLALPLGATGLPNIDQVPVDTLTIA